MKFSATEISAMVRAMADSILIGSTAAYGVFQAAGKTVPMYDGSVITTGPLLTVSEATAALITENSSIITIGSTAYQATQKVPDGAGFVDIELTKDY